MTEGLLLPAFDDDARINAQVDSKGEIALVAMGHRALEYLSLSSQCVSASEDMAVFYMSIGCCYAHVADIVSCAKCAKEMVAIKTDKMLGCLEIAGS